MRQHPPTSPSATVPRRAVVPFVHRVIRRPKVSGSSRGKDMRLTCSVLCLMLSGSISARCSASTQVVTTSSDAVPAPSGSLRAALEYAAANPGTAINFNIPGSGGVNTIRLVAPLPLITADGTVLDGTTQPGFASTPLIQLDGSGAGDGTDGLATALTLTAARCRVSGLAIRGFANNGIELSGGASGNTIGGIHASQGTSQGNVISGNLRTGIYIAGSATSGNLVQGNSISGSGTRINHSSGIRLAAGAHDNTIGGTVAAARNVIFSNRNDGVSLRGAGTTRNLVQGNFIGTNSTGLAPLRNGDNGVSISDGAANNTLGGTASGAGNVISGNTRTGIFITGLITGLATAGNLVQGNLIGTDVSGTTDLGNGSNGVTLALGAAGNTIGGTAPGARNIISGNAGLGVSISGKTTDHNFVQRNYIGTSLAGTSAIGNVYGVKISEGQGGGPQSNHIEGNLISGNQVSGVLMVGANTGHNLVQGNTIGSDATASRGALPNGLHGVDVWNATHNTIGAPLSVSDDTAIKQAGNLIAFNGGDGVHVRGTAFGITIRGNDFHANGGLGINLVSTQEGSFGVTANDQLDRDSGPNALQNFPRIGSITVSGGVTTVTGALDSTPGSAFRLDLYRSAEVDPSGFGEGATYLASQDVRTDAQGHSDFSTQVPVPAGERVILTLAATATSGSTNGSTSEFSPVPFISGFSPIGGPVGTLVTIRGVNFLDGVNLLSATAIKFGGVEVSHLPTPGSGDFTATLLRVPVPAGATTGRITVVGPAGTAVSDKDFRVSEHPANDDFQSAELLSGSSGASNGTSLGATAQSDEREPNHAGQPASHSVWYRWTAPSSGSFSFNTRGSDFDTRLAVYTGSRLSALASVAANDDAGGDTTNAVTFNAHGGQSYAIAVDGVRETAGSIRLAWNSTNSGPPNDNFSGAEGISGETGHLTGTNVGAGRESFEPGHAGSPPARSVWYQWVAPRSGQATFDTYGSRFDTRLAVYTGNRLDSLEPVGRSDDSGPGHTSRVSLPVVAGTRYYIAVDGFEGAEGGIILNWSLGRSRAATLRWVGGSGRWNESKHWMDDTNPEDPPRVPAVEDTVSITAPSDARPYTVTLDVDAEVAALTLGGAGSSPTLAIGGRSLTLDGTGTVNYGATLGLGAVDSTMPGTLIVHGDLTVTGVLDWTLGSITGKRNVSINGDGRLEIHGTGDKVLDQATLSNFSIVDWTDGNIKLREGAVIRNYAQFRAAIHHDAALVSNGILPQPAFFNTHPGSFTKSTTATLTFNDVAFNNDAAADVREGDLTLQGGGLAFGSFAIATGARIIFSSDYFFSNEASQFTGTGEAIVAGGVFKVDTAVTASNLTLGAAPGVAARADTTIAGLSDLEIDHSFLWSSGTMRDTGTTTLKGATTISGSGAKALAGRSVTTTGTLNWDGSTITSGDGAVFTNNGTFNAQNGATFAYSGSGARLTFTNAGTLNPGNGPVASTAPAGGAAAGGEQGKSGSTSAIGINNWTGNYSQTAMGTLNVQIGGANNDDPDFPQYDQTNVSGMATLNGALNIAMVNGYRPQVGDHFKVMSYGSHQGQFSPITGRELGGDLYFEPQYTAAGLILETHSHRPTIAGFLPPRGAPGTPVTITGTNFSGVQAVKFNGRAATFTVTSATQIRCTVPAGATSGRITVTVGNWMATSQNSFTVTSPVAAAGDNSSPVTLSTATASTASASVRLTFSATLDAGATGDPAGYGITVNGRAVVIESASYHASSPTVTLDLHDGALWAGDSVEVRWSGLRDEQGRELASGQTVLIAH